jgi:hypothetical protein
MRWPVEQAAAAHGPRSRGVLSGQATPSQRLSEAGHRDCTAPVQGLPVHRHRRLGCWPTRCYLLCVLQ